MPSFEIDGSWVDLVSVGIALLFSLAKYFLLERKKFISRVTAYDFATGTSLFPMLMLGLSVFSSDILEALLEANTVTLSVAGLFALFSMLEDEFEKEEPKRRGRRSNEKK